MIYWINLKRSTERRKHMEKLLKDPAFDSVKKIRVNATDARQSFKKLTFPVENALSINNKVTDEEYGCLVSHLETIRQFSNSTFNTAIILEDDVSLDMKPYWHKTIRQLIEEAPKDWEILKLQNLDAKQTELYAKLTYPCYKRNKLNKINKKPYCNWSMAAYLIHKRAALKLMRMWNGKTYQLPPNTFHVADYIMYNTLTSYVYKTPYFIVRKDNNSNISYKHTRIDTNRTRRLFLSKIKTRKRR